MFTVVNVSVLVLRKDHVGHNHFRTYTPVAVLGAVTSGALTLPFARADNQQYVIAAWLLLLGVVLWAFTYWHQKRTGAEAASYDDIPPDEIP